MSNFFRLCVLLPCFALAQSAITIDGRFDDWLTVPLAVTDSADDVHDTDGYPPGGAPTYMQYSDVDILEVKFTHDSENLYGYMRAGGYIGRTSAYVPERVKDGRYYFIFTIDVDDDTLTGYPLREGGYYPDSPGYDMNMEVEFYNGSFNTGHYINHEFLTRQQAEIQGLQDLQDGVVRLALGTYDFYTQWVSFSDSSFVLVSDRGPVIQGIITIAVSPDGHEAEMKAPMWGFLRTPERKRIIDLGQTIVVSASLEGSGELSEAAAARGYAPGSKSVWGSDTAPSFRYEITRNITLATHTESIIPKEAWLSQNYPNPFNAGTALEYSLAKSEYVSLKIYDLLGRELDTLVEAEQGPGHYRVFWHGRDRDQQLLSSGIYFCRLVAGSQHLLRKLVMQR